VDKKQYFAAHTELEREAASAKEFASARVDGAPVVADEQRADAKGVASVPAVPERQSSSLAEEQARQFVNGRRMIGTARPISLLRN
jgi:hypothetical protein